VVKKGIPFDVTMIVHVDVELAI